MADPRRVPAVHLDIMGEERRCHLLPSYYWASPSNALPL